MQNKRLLASLLSVAVLATAASAADFPPPPETKMDPVTETIHGVEITDPYRWLENQKSPATREWIERQNRYAAEILERFPARKQLARRLGELMRSEERRVG